MILVGLEMTKNKFTKYIEVKHLYIKIYQK